MDLILALLIILSLHPGSRGGEIRRLWSEWDSSERLCNRKCYMETGNKKAHRFCQICLPECMRSASNVGCAGEDRKPISCYRGDQCQGKGPFIGDWTEWQTVDNKCPSPEHTCRGVKADYGRECRFQNMAAWPLKDGCPGSKAKKDSCPCRKAQPSSLTAEVGSKGYGTWAQWGGWRCNAPCVYGVKAKRFRECEGSSAGMFCLPDANDNSDTEESTCMIDDKLICVKAWGAWSKWTLCPEDCGAVVQRRERLCDQGHGANCVGEPDETKKCPGSFKCNCGIGCKIGISIGVIAFVGIVIFCFWQAAQDNKRLKGKRGAAGQRGRGRGRGGANRPGQRSMPAGPGLMAGMNMPGQMPGMNMPGQMPGMNMPGQMPGMNMPGQMPGMNMPGMNMPGQMPGMNMPGMNMPGMNMPGQMPGMNMPGAP